MIDFSKIFDNVDHTNVTPFYFLNWYHPPFVINWNHSFLTSKFLTAEQGPSVTIITKMRSHQTF